MDVDRQAKLGKELIEVLDLKVKENGRVDTEWGDKTPYGLYQTLKRFIEESEGGFYAAREISTS